MVGGRMAEGGIRIGPAPGQNGGAVNDQVTGVGEAHPEPGAHQPRSRSILP
jgi:hypothetical protein